MISQQMITNRLGGGDKAKDQSFVYIKSTSRQWQCQHNTCITIHLMQFKLVWKHQGRKTNLSEQVNVAVAM